MATLGIKFVGMKSAADGRYLFGICVVSRH